MCNQSEKESYAEKIYRKERDLLKQQMHKKIGLNKWSPQKKKQMQPVEDLISVELLEGKIRFTTKIRTQITDVKSKSIINCLRKNADVFAFSSFDLTGVDTEVALHSLNIDPAVKPIKKSVGSL